jgi:hypothetical protein
MGCVRKTIYVTDPWNLVGIKETSEANKTLFFRVVLKGTQAMEWWQLAHA